MKQLVIADIHGNWPALESVLEQEEYDQLIVVGDIVGILGSPARCIEEVHDAEHVVFGNHDARVRPDFTWVPHTEIYRTEHTVVTEDCSTEQIQWLATLPDRIVTDDLVIAHAWPFPSVKAPYGFVEPHGFSHNNPGVDPYAFTTIGQYANNRLVICGHTHEQHHVDLDRFDGICGDVLNPGSVGVPYDGTAEYAVVDGGDADLRETTFDTDEVLEYLAQFGIDESLNRTRSDTHPIT